MFIRSVYTKVSSCSKKMTEALSLKEIVEKLEKFAPLTAAESWDNVGLLVEPYRQRPIKKIMLTNDLTEQVMHEAVKKEAAMIISYHPPIFAPLKRITQSNWKERIIATCLAENIAVYSPHTAWDVVKGGVNDWLASAFDHSCKNITPIQANPALPDGCGTGRIFDTDVSLGQAIAAVEQHVGTVVHVAMAEKHTQSTDVRRVAVCAGSGSTVLKGVEADLYVTGEMSHHDVLDAVHRQTTVVLCNHSNSERGFLKQFQAQMQKILQHNECEIILSEMDEDPLKTYVDAAAIKQEKSDSS